MSGHTLGPWEAIRDGSHIFIRNSRFFICDFDNYCGIEETKKANARLIAAAPDLLAALLEYMKHGHSENFGRMCEESVAKAREPA